MTGGEVVYVDCLDGYERNLIGGAEKNPGFCLDEGNFLVFSVPSKTVRVSSSLHETTAAVKHGGTS